MAVLQARSHFGKTAAFGASGMGIQGRAPAQNKPDSPGRSWNFSKRSESYCGQAKLVRRSGC